MARLRIGIDIGGTFTDLVAVDEETGESHTVKVLTTPEDPTSCVKQAFKEMFDIGLEPEHIVMVVHGTTVATNALLEHKGAKAFLFITEGFEAIPEVGDQTRDPNHLYDLFYERPPMLIPQRRIVGVSERVNSRGDVLQAVSEEAIKSYLNLINKENIESVAVCFLFSFMNPSNEQLLSRLLHYNCPNIKYTSLSHDVLPQIREHVRLSTTIVDAYVGPILRNYLEGLEQSLQLMGLNIEPYIVHSGGGMMTTRMAKNKAVWCIESGPAAGTVAASQLSNQLGLGNLIAFDMGGTTAKFGLIVDGQPGITAYFKPGGYPIGIPVLDLVEIGAGGGSIALIDSAGLLKVGPQSAGAAPGPVCYGRGGVHPTVTDADLVLGYLNPDYFLGGRMKLDVHAAEEAIRTQVAQPLNVGMIEAAHGIFTIVNVNMAQALRTASVGRGHDPRDFKLVAFGGAGPTHGGALAEEVGIPRIIIPLNPGVNTAMGLTAMDVKHEYLISRVGPLSNANMNIVRENFAMLEARAKDEMESEGFFEDEVRLYRYLDLRYVGQGYELRVPVGQEDLSERIRDLLRSKFNDSHQRSYGTKAEIQPIEIVNYRLTAITELPKSKPRLWEVTGSLREAFRGNRDVYFDNDYLACPTYDRFRLPRQNRIYGPAVVEQPDSTIVIYPRQSAYTDDFGNLIIEIPMKE